MADAAPIVTISAVVTGRVQGVGFRQYTQGHATRLGLVGWVRNLPNGSVELAARGPQPIIDDLLARIRRGPRYADVADVAVRYGPRDDIPADGFYIK